MVRPQGRLRPNLLLIGNPKTGSTFLFNCLRSGPFDPNLLCGSDSSMWKSCHDRAYLLTTLGAKKEFNFWGGPGWSWGMDWYEGLHAPLHLWEWSDGDDRHSVRSNLLRGGDNVGGEDVAQLCLLDNTSAAPGGSGAACHRFPIECLHGKPLVRPGCGIMRPLPPRSECSSSAASRRGRGQCRGLRMYISHAWPATAEVSPRALTLDPSINTFMNAPDAPRLLRLHSVTDFRPTALQPAPVSRDPESVIRFVVMVRDPFARALSSARMMLEWKWEKEVNASVALARDLAALRRCGIRSFGADTSVAIVTRLGQELSDQLSVTHSVAFGVYRRCLARNSPLNHVRAGVYAAGAVAWLRVFPASRFLWLDTDDTKSLGAAALLRRLSSFAQLPSAHLAHLPPAVRAACERRSHASGTGSHPAEDTRMVEHQQLHLPPTLSQEITAAYVPFNRLLGQMLEEVPHLRNVSWLHPKSSQN